MTKDFSSKGKGSSYLRNVVVKWGTATNPDLAFVSESLGPMQRSIMDRFPKSQHRPSVITEIPLAPTVKDRPAKRWNLRKADWKAFADACEERSVLLPTPKKPNIDKVYRHFCNTLKSAAKSSIPRGYRKS